MSATSLYNETYIRFTHAVYGTERSPRTKLAGVVALLSSVALFGIIDVTNTKVDVCAYAIDGNEERGNMLSFTPEGIADLVSGDCFPSIEVGNDNPNIHST